MDVDFVFDIAFDEGQIAGLAGQTVLRITDILIFGTNNIVKAIADTL